MSVPEHTERHATKLEMAHVLFMDIVGYSKLPMDHQAAVLTRSSTSGVTGSNTSCPISAPRTTGN